MKEIGQLFIIFLRIGGFTFGGGYAMLPMIKHELVKEKEWATEEEIIDYYAIGQCTPGIIAINTATLIGYKRKGVLGAAAATLGMITPSLVIIILIATFFQRFQKHQVVRNAFSGIKVGVIALIVHVVMDMGEHSIKDRWGATLFIVSFLLLAVLGVSPVIVIIGSALIGIGLQSYRFNEVDDGSPTEESGEE